MKATYTTEEAAREDARKCGDHYTQIIESRGMFYVETDEEMNCMLRSWERRVFLGSGRDA